MGVRTRRPAVGVSRKEIPLFCSRTIPLPGGYRGYDPSILGWSVLVCCLSRLRVCQGETVRAPAHLKLVFKGCLHRMARWSAVVINRKLQRQLYVLLAERLHLIEVMIPHHYASSPVRHFETCNQKV